MLLWNYTVVVVGGSEMGFKIVKGRRGLIATICNISGVLLPFTAGGYMVASEVLNASTKAIENTAILVFISFVATLFFSSVEMSD